MSIKPLLLALGASVLCVPVAVALSEYGIEGMGVVSTPGNEARATVSPDGRRIVWGGSDRPGGAGGWELWQAEARDGRWVEPQPLPINSPGNDFDPFFSADGRWLYFASDRAGGFGGDDLYRVAISADGGYGKVENLGAGVNTAGDERAPTLSHDGGHLLFASDGHGGAGGRDLFVAQWHGKAFAGPKPVPGINTVADEFDAAWLDDGRALLYAKSSDAARAPVRLLLAACDGASYVGSAPWTLSFNTAEGNTSAPVVDVSKPNEVLVTGSARAPRAGKQDIYRVRVPATAGRTGCS